MNAEIPRPSELNPKNKGRFKELKFAQLNGNLGDVPRLLGNMQDALIENKAHAALMECSILDTKNPQDNLNNFKEKFNPIYKTNIENLIQPLPARFTTLGDSEVSIGMVAVVPEEGIKLTIKPAPLPENAPPLIGPYSPGIIVETTDQNGTSQYVYTSGQLSYIKDDDGKAKFVEGSLEEQTDITWNNTLAILNAANMTSADLVKLHIIVTSDADKIEVEKIMRKKLGEQHYELPIDVKGLVIPGARVEMIGEASSK